MTIDESTGVITWTPAEQQRAGDYEVTVRVSDAAELFDTASFVITVAEGNTPPELASIANQTVNAGETVTLTAVATDADGPANELTFSLSDDAPTGATIDPITGEFQFETAVDVAQSYQFTVIVTDSASATDSMTFSIQATLPEFEANSRLIGIVFEDNDQDSFLWRSSLRTQLYICWW